MNTNVLREQCTVEVKGSTRTALGQADVTWSAVGDYWTRRVPVDVQTRIAYQQKNTVVTDRFIFNPGVDIRIGKHRLIWRGKVYDPIESAMNLDGQVTVLAKEVIT